MKKTLILMAVVVCLTALKTMAQSISYAKSLIEQGSYLDAAKQLRPLADGGDAEAQYLAATLFFEGKGVPKNDDQGVKYATLSANQGNTNAMLLLADHYKGNGQLQKYFATLEHYVTIHPYLKKEFIGLRLAECYMRGWGVEQNEETAWRMASENKDFSRMKSAYSNQWEAYKSRHPEEYGTMQYDRVSVERCPRHSKILSVRFEGDFTYVTVRQTNIYRIRRWICSTPETYIIADGKRYRMIRSTLTSTPSTFYLKPGESHDYTFTFGHLPRHIRSFDMIEDVNQGDRWLGVAF